MPANQKVTFNLDTIERERTYEPYTVALSSGDVITLTDPAELDWQELASIENPQDFFATCMSREDQEKFLAERVPAWKLRLLIEDFQRHYGLDTAGNARASRTF